MQKLIAIGVFLVSTGIFAILFTFLGPLEVGGELPYGEVWMVLTAIIGISSLGVAVAMAISLISTGLKRRREIYYQFLLEVPSRKTLPEKEFRRQFDRWTAARKV